MKFIDLKKQLKNNILTNYLLMGNDEFLITRSYDLILNAVNLQMQELNLSIFNGDIIDFDDVVKSLNTMPVFCDKKLVYVNLVNRMAGDVKNLNVLSDYLNNPNPTSVLVVNCGVKNKDYFNSYVKLMEVVNCDKLEKDLVNKFITAEIAKFGKKITIDAQKLLFDYALGDLSKMNNEVTKLCSYVGDREVIIESDVNLIATKSVEFQIFELTQALGKKEEKKVYEILGVLKSKREEFKGVLGLIYNHFRRLFYVSITKANRTELATMLGIQEYAVSKSQEQARLFSKISLKNINDICMQLDYEMKTSAISVENAVEYLVLKILNC